MVIPLDHAAVGPQAQSMTTHRRDIHRYGGPSRNGHHIGYIAREIGTAPAPSDHGAVIPQRQAGAAANRYTDDVGQAGRNVELMKVIRPPRGHQADTQLRSPA